MWNKKLGIKLFFLLQILILPFAFHALAIEDTVGTDADTTVSSTVSVTEEAGSTDAESNNEVPMEIDETSVNNAEENVSSSDNLTNDNTPAPESTVEQNEEVLIGEENVVENIEETPTSSPDIIMKEIVELPSETNNLVVDSLTADKIVEIEQNVYVEQSDWIRKNDKYKYINKEDTAEGNYEVHEYETPDGRIGYNILFYDEFGRVVQSKGYGVEAGSRTWTKTYPTSVASSTTQ